MPDVNMVGAGPNGLAAAVVLARAGLNAHVTERAPGVPRRGGRGALHRGGRPRARSTALAGHGRRRAAARRPLRRYRYGSGVAKVEVALSGPVPWANPEVGLAPTVHLGGSRAEVLEAERMVARGQVASHPYVLLTQPGVLDATRAPGDGQTLWPYTHVPAGSGADQTEAIVRQIERFAPGIRQIVLASTARSAQGMADLNPNLVGGDILGGAVTLRQLVKRPVLSPAPWKTPLPGLYLCSASTPPGTAVHGMNGWYAATLVLRHEFGIESLPSLSPDAALA